MPFSDTLTALAARAEEASGPLFAVCDRIAQANTERVLDAFARCRVGLPHFAPSTGYGYDDLGRDTLDRVYAETFGCEDALVRPQIINGTHAILLMLRGILPGKGGRMLSLTGAPYDTLSEALSSLRGEGLVYDEIPFGGIPDPGFPALAAARVREFRPDVVYIQRSKGYGDRITLSVRDIRLLTAAAKAAKPDVIVAVDNCYGEFTEAEEPFGQVSESYTGPRPLHFRSGAESPADIAAGSLIKNPGGGLAPCGGYIAGKKELVEKAAEALTVPGIGREAGANPAGWRLYYQGFFLAPHVTAQALKTMIFAANLLPLAGFETSPAGDEMRSDIIQTVRFGRPEPLIAFCRGIQASSPVDSFAVCEPWAMPGYRDEVIMAAGAFVQGSSIELSADAPLREPYLLYMQGGLTYESGKLAVMRAVEKAIS